jgi:hypothetical protein
LPAASRAVTIPTDRLLSLKILSGLAKADEPMSRMRRRKKRCILLRDRITMVSFFSITVSG